MAKAPPATTQEDEDTYETRQFNLRAQDKTYDKAQQVFVQWKITLLRCIKLYKDTVA